MTDQQKQLATTQDVNKVDYIDLEDFLFRLLDRWVFVLSLALICGIGVGIITHFCVTPKYKATSTIYVLSRRDSAINMSDLQIGSALTSDYIKVFKMWEVHDEVISNLDLPYSYKQMQKMLSVINDNDTRMLDISITSANPVEAADIANEYAKVASQYISETMSTDKPNIMSVALVPDNPVSPSLIKNVAIGILFGLVCAAAIIFIQMMNDDKYKTAEDIREYVGLATLAVIPLEEAYYPTARKGTVTKKRTGSSMRGKSRQGD